MNIQRRDSVLARRIKFKEIMHAGNRGRQHATSQDSVIGNSTGGQLQMKSDSGTSVFPKIVLHLTWPEPLPQGPGLQNLGNTCFLNSTLQCLTYTPPLALYLIKRNHSQTCRQTVHCMFCELERHIFRCFAVPRPHKSICPKPIVGRLKNIAKHLRIGRQEDAHEFLRYFVDAIQSSCLAGYGKLEPKEKETTAVHQLFGGYLQSRIHCTVCGTDSCTTEPALDLSLEIKQVNTVDRALAHFTKEEMLSGDNKYRCSKCKKLVNATKRLLISQAPPVLVLHLKRFDFIYSSHGAKITKKVLFTPELDIKPFVWNAKKRMLYSLYGVLVHAGHSCNSGHYYSYVKGANGMWYCMNDTEVRQVSLNNVLDQNAYMLFYVAHPETQTNGSLSGTHVAPKGPTTHPKATQSAAEVKKQSPQQPQPRDASAVQSPSKPKVATPSEPTSMDIDTVTTKPESVTPSAPILPRVRSTDSGWKVSKKKSLSEIKADTGRGQVIEMAPKKIESTMTVPRQAGTIPFAETTQVSVWDDIDLDSALDQRDELIRSIPKLKRPALHDIEYDQGKLKKKKNKVKF